MNMNLIVVRQDAPLNCRLTKLSNSNTQHKPIIPCDRLAKKINVGLCIKTPVSGSKYKSLYMNTLNAAIKYP